jgi:hypothetical protein
MTQHKDHEHHHHHDHTEHEHAGHGQQDHTGHGGLTLAENIYVDFGAARGHEIHLPRRRRDHGIIPPLTQI